MPGPETGFVPTHLQKELANVPLPEIQAHEKAREIVSHARDVSQKFLAKLDLPGVRQRLVQQGAQEETLSPRGTIYEDLSFHQDAQVQTVALLAWSLQHTLAAELTPDTRPENLLAEAMQPVDYAFSQARKYLHRYPKQHPEQIELARILGIPDDLNERYRRIAIRTRLHALRQQLPLHGRAHFDSSSAVPTTDMILRALSSINLRIPSEALTAQAEALPKPEVNSHVLDTASTTETVEPSLEQLTSELVEAQSVDEEVATSMRTIFFPTYTHKQKQGKHLYERSVTLGIPVVRNWEVTSKDKRQTLKALQKAIKRGGFTMSVQNAEDFASLDLHTRILPRALEMGLISAAEIGDMPPLPDGREVIVGKHIVMDGDKQRVRYSYDIATSLGTARSPEQLQKDQQLARDHIYQEMKRKWYGSDSLEEQEDESLQSWLRIAKGKVSRHQINQLNIPPTDGRFVLATKIEEGTENGEATYSYDLSMPENKPDNRTPEQKERDRREAIRRIHTALMGKNQE